MKKIQLEAKLLSLAVLHHPKTIVRIGNDIEKVGPTTFRYSVHSLDRHLLIKQQNIMKIDVDLSNETLTAVEGQPA